MKKNICTDFELFINPNDSKEFSKVYFYISYKNLDYCSFVIYLCCPTINGELSGNFKVISRSYIDQIINDDYVILAINYLDNIVLEVI